MPPVPSLAGSSPVRLALLLVAAVFVGAGLFGLWHVVVGGLVHGNARAAAFGAVLATAAGASLALDAWLLRRLRG